MIKKAVLPLLTVPFLMLFSDFAFSWSIAGTYNSMEGANNKVESFANFQPTRIESFYSAEQERMLYRVYHTHAMNITSEDINQYDLYTYTFTDNQCSSSDGQDLTTSPSVANYLSSGGTLRTNGGACSVSAGAGVMVCAGTSDSACSIPIQSNSTGNESSPTVGISGGLSSGDPVDTPDDFSPPSYLTPLDSASCSTSKSCMNVGDQGFIVDWNTAPDHFSYVGDDGTVYDKSSAGGSSGGSDSGGDTGGGDTGGSDSGDDTGGGDTGGSDSGGDTGSGDTGGSDSGGDTGSGDSGGSDSDGDTGGGDTGGSDSDGDTDGDSGGSDSGGDTGGSSGGGSTAPDFEFDESGIIEAIGSSGESNQSAINHSASRITTGITSQTQSLENTLDNQTRGIKGSLGDLKDGLVDAIKGIDGSSVSLSLDGLVDGLADRFDGKVDEVLNPDDMPGDGEAAEMIDGEGATEDVMQSLEEGVETQDAAIYDEFEGVFEGGGIIDNTLAPLRNFITSFLPNLPTGGCTPLTFGEGQRSFTIDCEGFNLLKAALSWVLFFLTAYQLISIPMDARKT